MGITGRRARREEQVFVSGTIPMEYVYTAGAALEPFFRDLRDKGELWGTECQICEIVYFPPTHFCEMCFERIDKRVKLPEHGTLESFTTAHYDHLGRKLEEPVTWGLIKLEGTHTTFVHRLLGYEKDFSLPRDELGIRVKAKLKPKGKRTGSMDDIEGFYPV